MLSNRPIEWPGFDKPIYPKNCGLNNVMGSLSLYAGSQNREQATSSDFKKRIWEKLGPNDKAIVIYQYFHVTQGLKSCAPVMEKEGLWHTSIETMNWTSLFFAAVPEARSRAKIVLFDEIDSDPHPENVMNPNGVLKVSARQAKRYPELDFGMELSHFSNTDAERGMDVFAEKAYLRESRDGKYYGTPSLEQMFDGVVWSHDADSYQLQGAETYLPTFCKP